MSICSETEVTTMGEFAELVYRLTRLHPDLVLVFRGQTHDFAPIPSAARPRVGEVPEEHLFVRHLWEYTAFNLMEFGGDRDDWDLRKGEHTAMAILQHYGYRSWFIDVTFDPLVALWFARNSFRSFHKLFGGAEATHASHPPEPLDHAFGMALHAEYGPHDGLGTVFVYGVDRGGSDRLIDLRSVFPESWKVRPRRQSAAELFEEGTGQGFEDLLVAQFTVAQEVVPPISLTTEYLFPADDDDRIYGALLGIPALVERNDVREFATIGKPLMEIPVYSYDGLSPESAVARMRVVIGAYRGTMEFDGVEANYITLPLTMWDPRREAYAPPTPRDEQHADRPANAPGSVRPPDVWPPGVLFFHTPITGMIGRYIQGAPTYPILRGFAAIRGEQEMAVTALFEISPGDQRLIDLGVAASRRPGGRWEPHGADPDPSAWGLVSLYLLLSALLADGSAVLYQTGEHNFGLYWVDAAGTSWVEPNGTRPDHLDPARDSHL